MDVGVSSMESHIYPLKVGLDLSRNTTVTGTRDGARTDDHVSLTCGRLCGTTPNRITPPGVKTSFREDKTNFLTSE